MVDFIKVITVLVVSAMGSLDVVDLVSQGCFQSLVVVVCADDVLIVGSKGSSKDYLRSTLEHGSTGREHTANNHKKQSTCQNQKNRFGVCGTKLRHFLCDVLGSLGCFSCCLACTLGCRCRCRSGVLTGFGGSIFFLDRLFLLPTGKRIGTGIGIVLFELLIKGIHIGFI